MTSFADPGSGQQPSTAETRDVMVNLDADVSGYSQGLQQAQQQTSALDGAVGKLVGSMSSLTKFAGRKLLQFSAADFAGLGIAVGDAASLEHQLGTLRATSKVTGSSMGQMKKELDDAFTRFPMARAQVVQLAEAINSLGVTDPKAVGRNLATFTKLGAATGENSTSLASSSIQLGRQMGNTTPDQLEGYSNALLTVSKNQGVAASGVLDFAQAVAPMARAAGIGEAAVLGISAAFQKAGADGAYAANTFNQITGDITQLSATGSPELAKYANFTGKSVADFRKQSGTDQITSVFKSIAKGGPEAMSFVTSLGLGQRAIRSVQAVAQSGGLEQAIAQAQGSSNDTKNLDDASAAALHGLAESGLELGNQFTKLGEMIGGPLLGPLTLFTNALTAGVELVNKVVSALDPLPSVLATIAGALAIPLGLLAGKAGLVLLGGAARGALGRNSAGREAFREGRQAGTNMLGPVGMSRDDAMRASQTGGRVADGTATARQRWAYNYGMSLGGNPPAPTPPPGGVTGPAAAARARGAASSVRAAAFGVPTWLMNMQTRGAQDGRTPNPNDRYAQRVAAGATPDPGLRESARTGTAMGAVRAYGRMYGESVRTIGSATAAVAGAGARAVGGAVSGAVSAAPAVIQRAASAVGGAAVVAGGAIGGAASKVGGALFSPMGMLAATVAVPLIGSIVSAIKEGNAAREDVSGALSGAGKYDQALDQSSTNLARFGQTVDMAANRLAAFANTPIDQLTDVTGADINAATKDGYEISDPALRDVVTQASDSGMSAADTKKQVLAYFDSIGVQRGSLDGATFTKYKQDLVNVMGVARTGEVENVMEGLASSDGVGTTNTLSANNLGTLASLAGSATPHGTDAELERYKNILGTGVSGLVSGTQESGDAAIPAQLVNLVSMGAKATGSKDLGQDDRTKAFFTMVQDTLGIDAGQLEGAVTDAAQAAGTRTMQMDASGQKVTGWSNYSNETDARAVLAMAIGNTDQGKALMEKYNLNPQQLLEQATNPAALPGAAEGDTAKQLATHGPLGEFAAGSTRFQRASIGDQAAMPGPQFAAAQELVGEAAKQAGGSLTEATSSLMTLSDQMGGMATPTGALIKSAADWARQLQSFKTVTYSREDQLAQATQTAAGSEGALSDPLASTDSVNQAKSDKVALEGQKESYRSYMIGRIQQLKQFGISQQRQIEDNNLSIARSERDFATQQTRSSDAYQLQRQYQLDDYGLQRVRAEDDYNLQVLHSQQDFQKQSQRSLESYQRGVDRQNEDHARDLARQAKASAQDIYDPFTRVQAKAVTDAGTLIYNLKEQNADIERQLAELQDLKSRGLSQDTIDTLRLGESGNAQQVSALVRSLDQNPDMLAEINAQVSQRLAGSTRLTQGSDNAAFRQGEEDYARQMARASVDFGIQQEQAAQDYETSMGRMADSFDLTEQRGADDLEKALGRSADAFTLSTQNAVEDHAKALSDMAINLQTSQQRAGEDLANSFIQYTGNFTSVFSQLTATSLSALGGYGSEAAGIINRELATVTAANPWLTGTATAPSTIPLTKGQRDELATVNAGRTSFSSLGLGFATGGISLTQQAALVSEHGPEAHIPLNSRGENFMAGLIARSLARGVTAAVSGGGGAVGSSSMTDNSVSFAGAEIQVVAQDPNAMAKALAAKAKLARLSSPTRH